MSVWLPPTVEEQSEVSLVSWGAKSSCPRSEHQPFTLLACANFGAVGRESSLVVKVNASNRSVVTNSGRAYRLVGAPAMQGDVAYVVQRWVFNWNAKVLSDTAPALMRCFAAAERSNGPPTAPQGRCAY